MTETVQAWRRKRVADAAVHLGGNAALGKRIGYANGAFIGQMISGHRPVTEKTIEKIEALPGMAGWFTPSWDGAQSDTTTVLSFPSSDKQLTDVVIRQWETGGAMGHGLVLHDQPGIIKEWTVSAEWLQQNVHRVSSPKNLAIVTGFGPSMQPVFNPGDPLLIDCGVRRADSDGVYFFRVGEEGFVKQLQRIPTADGLIYRAKSYNPLYDPFDITGGMDFEVFGRVVKVWKGEEF